MHTKQHRPGFTLVELLTVIVIIGILASLITVAAFAAIVAAKNAAIRAELNNLHDAFLKYKAEHGDYPPSILTNANKQAIMRHLNKVSSRCNASTEADALIAKNLNQAEALVYWLSGLSSNKLAPITDTTSTRTPFFDFDQSHLQTVSGKTVYIPSGGGGAPYVYFENRDYANTNSNYAGVSPAAGNARPYQWDTDNNGTADGYANPQSFQIISAGLDANYGADSATKLFPGGTNYNVADEDNITNFAERALGDMKP